MKTNYRDIIKGKVFSPKNIIWIPVIMISALQLLRIFFEFPSSDECYYFTQPLRFAQGDKPFLDSWDSIQTLGIFLMPFYKLYISLAGTKGIVLFSRFLYFIFAHITAALIYVVLRKDIEHKTAALLSLTVAVYAPFSLYTIGYNQLLDLFGIMGTMIFFIGISCNGRKCSWILCFLAGIIHSAMVASYASSIAIMPILALLICLIGISYAKLHRGGKWTRFVLGYVSGIAIVGLLLFLYISFAVGWKNFIVCIEQIRLYFNNIHGVQISEILYTLILVIFDELFPGRTMRVLLAVFCFVVLCTAAARVFDHVFQTHYKKVYYPAVGFSFIWVFLCAWHSARAFADMTSLDNLLTIDYAAYIAMLLPLLMLLPLKNDILKWKWFALLPCLSLLQAVCVSMTSGGTWYQARHALIGTVIYVMILMYMQAQSIFDDYKSKFDKHRVFRLGNFSGILLSLFVLTTFLSFEYWDVYGKPNGSIFKIDTVRAESGPAAGIYITEEQDEFNRHLVDGIRRYAKPGEGLLVMELFPYAYGVEGSMRMLTNNTWAATLYTRGSYTDNIYFSPVLDYFEHKNKIPYMIVYFGEPLFLANPDPNYAMHQFILEHYQLAETFHRRNNSYTYTIFINKEEKND